VVTYPVVVVEAAAGVVLVKVVEQCVAALRYCM
jgi:hypothetical protein